MNSLGDSGTGSGFSGDLLYCITQANANPNTVGSVIEFDPTVFGSPQTITLSSTLELSETAGPEVIDGPGANLVTVSGNNAVEVFSIGSGVTAQLTGLTISNGLAAQGGGLFIDGGTVSLTNVTVSNNQAVGANGAAGAAGQSGPGGAGGDGNSGLGGGIYLAGGSLTLNDDTIASNVVRGGAGGAGGGGGAGYPNGVGGGPAVVAAPGDWRPAAASMWLTARLSRTTTSSNRIKPSVAREGMAAAAATGDGARGSPSTTFGHLRRRWRSGWQWRCRRRGGGRWIYVAAGT